MDKVMQIGNMTKNANRDNPQRNRVYSVKGVAATLTCCGGGNLEPLIIERYEIQDKSMQWV
ncbi:MAG: hypothetical protein KBT34_10575 [Prevotella sp.]|nr:hypothetical protein [Candidatus Prevotella equi]